MTLYYLIFYIKIKPKLGILLSCAQSHICITYLFQESWKEVFQFSIYRCHWKYYAADL